jgi:hypothetical protein
MQRQLTRRSWSSWGQPTTRIILALDFPTLFLGSLRQIIPSQGCKLASVKTAAEAGCTSEFHSKGTALFLIASSRQDTGDEFMNVMPYKV